MKKSKIIVPAMALIAFSSLASIAGSVAWFTANRQATISAGTYAVVKTTTNMEYKVTAGIGTTVNANNVVYLDGNQLTDGSFNHKNGTFYTPNDGGNGLDNSKSALAIGSANLETNLKRATLTTGDVYTAVTWDIEFTIGFGAEAGDYGLYLNTTANNSRFESGAATEKTSKGFRMAIIPNGSIPSGSDQTRIVFADLQEESNCKYVASLDNFSGSSYVPTDFDLIDSSYNAALPDSSTSRADALARPDYLGYFGFQASTKVKLKYTVVAWYEGTDPEIKNRDEAEDYQSVAATLVFDAVKLKDAASTSHTLTYYANDGSDTTTTGTITNGNVTLANNSFAVPTGKEFGGWALSATGAKVYDAGQQLTRLNADLSLYAVWEDVFAASFDGNGATDGSIDSMNTSHGKVTLPDGSAFTAPSGKVFDGWADTDIGEKAYDAGDVVTLTAAKTFYAHWIDE